MSVWRSVGVAKRLRAYLTCLEERIPEGASGESRERHAVGSDFIAQGHAGSVGRCKQLGCRLVHAIPGTYSVNNMANARSKTEGRGQDRPTGRTGRQWAQRLQKVWACGAMNRAVDTTAADKRRVRGRDDNVNVSSGDVTPDNLDLHELKAARTQDCLINATVFSLSEVQPLQRSENRPQE